MTVLSGLHLGRGVKLLRCVKDHTILYFYFVFRTLTVARYSLIKKHNKM